MFVAGISFKTAPVALREQLAVTPSRLIETAGAPQRAGRPFRNRRSPLATGWNCTAWPISAEGWSIARLARAHPGGCLPLYLCPY
jgi:hypothetical protein